LELTEALIEGTIDSITGFIVARAAGQLNKPLDEIMDAFLLSHTYELLCDKDTGLYWDSLPETFGLFMNDLQDKQS
jgi:hypothetical protein